eukprot:TRINITY_DN7602_c0_g1_i2.p1 TRINITY_DN7602_c0_g1~~TRINITY_DN7602_c0_g1_i2.p1  ORF type:complete len:342 (-),score=37.79 TRINITY_DN7602_c0_g1_i2:122-1087(-)
MATTLRVFILIAVGLVAGFGLTHYTTSAQSTTTPTNTDTSDCPPWSFYGDTGPLYWGELCDAYAKCETGLEQSPIDILIDESAVDPTLSAIQFKYTAPTATNYSVGVPSLPWTGNSITFPWGSNNTIARGPLPENTVYKLIQLRYHSPSSNHYEDAGYPLEIQLIHQSASGQYAVVTVLFDADDRYPSDFLTALYANMAGASNPPTPDLITLMHDSMTLGYWTTMGSVPVPPCTENVIWVTAVQIMYAPRDLLNSFGGVNSRRARPIQPLNARVIRQYHPPQENNTVAGLLIALSMIFVALVMLILLIIVVRYKMRFVENI